MRLCRHLHPWAFSSALVLPDTLSARSSPGGETGASTAAACGKTVDRAGVSVVISPSVFTGCGRRVQISTAAQPIVRTSFHMPCRPLQNAG